VDDERLKNRRGVIYGLGRRFGQASLIQSSESALGSYS
jgi:hypothetical protein